MGGSLFEGTLLSVVFKEPRKKIHLGGHPKKQTPPSFGHRPNSAQAPGGRQIERGRRVPLNLAIDWQCSGVKLCA